MKAYICDRTSCAKQVEPKAGSDMLPNGWYSLTQYYRADGTYAASRNSLHFCSAACLLDEASEASRLEAEEQLVAEPPPPAPTVTEEDARVF